MCTDKIHGGIARNSRRAICAGAAIIAAAFGLIAALSLAGCSEKDKDKAAALGKLLAHSCAADIVKSGVCARRVAAPDGAVYNIRIERTAAASAAAQ